ncbi:hypothetical protein [Pedobacter rhodius]|uniref:YD repeat-containing protein n=1 Tax=Pedobacter rhodius TaxID=3004098 RepID=A0ABT4KXP5_9SPHI|nr:hypothetical protein [Pedobacter sp. SJ11]MCZ4222643.1 hypothetical protein [Pedobacter sp. SJ11]
MKNTLYVTFITLIFLSCKSVEPLKGHEKYFGRPKEILIDSYSGIGELKKSNYQTIEQYDKKGRLVTLKSVGINFMCFKYDYDKHGNMIKLSFLDDKGTIIGETYKKYNKKSKLIYEESWRHNQEKKRSIIYSYNKKGKLSEAEATENGTLLHKETYQYRNGNTVVSTSFDSKNNKTNSRTKIAISNNIETVILQNGKGDTTSIYSNKFDRYGRKDGEERLYPKPTIQASHVKRILDSKNNCIVETITLNNGYISVEKRMITYW